MSSADNLCNELGPRSGPTECRSCSGSKLFDTDDIPKEFFEKVDFKERKKEKVPSGQEFKHCFV